MKRKPKKAKDGLHALKRGGWSFRIYTFGSKTGPRKSFTLPKGTTRAEAEAYLAAEKAKAKALAGKPFLRHFTVRDAWGDMETYYRGSGAAAKTVTEVLRAGSHVLPLLGERRLSDLRAADVETYQRRRLEEKAAAATINQECTWFRTAIRRSLRARWIAEDPLPSGSIPKVAGQPKVPPPLTPAEWGRFRDAVENEDLWANYAARSRVAEHRLADRREELRAAAAAFRFILLTGSRISELVDLTWEAVDLEAGRLAIYQRKVRSPKTLPLSPVVRGILEERRRAAPAAHVFTMRGKPWTNEALQSFFRSLALASGLRAGPTPHTLRHSAASWLADAGVPEAVVRSILGHAAGSMTARYTHPSEAALLEALVKLEDVETGRRAPVGRQHEGEILAFRPVESPLSATS